MPALVIQIVTGLLLAHQALPDIQWFRFQPRQSPDRRQTDPCWA
jgi:hypothetical protein